MAEATTYVKNNSRPLPHSENVTAGFDALVKLRALQKEGLGESVEAHNLISQFITAMLPLAKAKASKFSRSSSSGKNGVTNIMDDHACFSAALLGLIELARSPSATEILKENSFRNYCEKVMSNQISDDRTSLTHDGKALMPSHDVSMYHRNGTRYDVRDSYFDVDNHSDLEIDEILGHVMKRATARFGADSKAVETLKTFIDARRDHWSKADIGRAMGRTPEVTRTRLTDVRNWLKYQEHELGEQLSQVLADRDRRKEKYRCR